MATGVGSRMIASVVLVAMGLLVFGCVTPIAATPHLFGIGLFAVSSEQPNPAVRYTHLNGFGIVLSQSRISAGIVDLQTTTASLDGQSYRATTPLVELAVGDEAEACAAEWARGPETIQPLGGQP